MRTIPIKQKHNTVVYQLYNGGPTYTTLAQHCTHVIQMLHGYWDIQRTDRNDNYVIDQTWLGVRCHPEWEFKLLSFSHSCTIQGPESTCWSGNCRCFTEILPKLYMTYARFFSDLEKSSLLHIPTHWVVKFWASIDCLHEFAQWTIVWLKQFRVAHCVACCHW